MHAPPSTCTPSPSPNTLNPIPPSPPPPPPMDPRRFESPKAQETAYPTRAVHHLSLRSLYAHADKSRDRRLRASFCPLLLLLLFALVSYAAFYPAQLSSFYTPNVHIHSTVSDPHDSTSSLSLSHLFFGIGGSAQTWESRRHYVELWWRPNEMRGHVWLDKNPSGGQDSWPPGCPSYKISGDASRFGPKVSAARIARIVKEAYLAALSAPGAEDLRWLVMGDDDTVFFPENLLAVLKRYDHRDMYYIGSVSESVEQAVFHSYAMAYGGGGFAVSMPAAAEISRILDRCLLRYSKYYGSDQRVQACMSELGVPLTRELGFHQMDIRGDPLGLLAAHPVAPLVSLHHLDYTDPIFPNAATRLEALARLIAASRADPSRTLQQTMCYDYNLNWSISVSWGYAVQVYPRSVAPDELQTPFQTFRTWGTYKDGPFTFNTRPLSSDVCRGPVLFFLDEARADGMGRVGSVTGYQKEEKEKRCYRKEYVGVEKLQSVQVIAPVMDPNDWKRAPRRQCCEAKMSWTEGSMNVRIRKCRLGETISPP